MSSNEDQLNHEIEILDSVADKSPTVKAKAYLKLSGPGWLQGAITLGGGSLAGALYLGTVSGYKLMWLQPLAMICGIIMLSAIAYVTLSTGQRPFGAINRGISPLLGWSWLIATVMANIVWCMPQFNLGQAAVLQNLMGVTDAGNTAKAGVCLVFLVLALLVNMAYQSGSKGIATFERILKSMVAVIVISFFLVVITLTVKGAVPWGEIIGGFFPNFGYLFNPTPEYAPLIKASAHGDWWTDAIAGKQRDVIITAFGTAVGINMTFLLPYSMLRKKWGKKHRGLAIFDLSIGLLVPFVLATGCVLIASASQFHGSHDDILGEDGKPKTLAKGYYGAFDKHPALIDLKDDARKEAIDKLPEADRHLGAMIVKRGNQELATTLKPLAGDFVAQIIFGVGVVGMALSTIIILMLINGFTFQELLGKPGDKTAYMIGCLVSGIAGFFGPFIWKGDAAAALAIPTSVIGASLIPIAYFTFLLMMNSRSVLGEHRPSGGKRYMWNCLMIAATSIATFGTIWVLSGKASAPGWKGMIPTVGLIFLGALFVVGVISFIIKEKQYSASK